MSEFKIMKELRECIINERKKGKTIEQIAINCQTSQSIVTEVLI